MSYAIDIYTRQSHISGTRHKSYLKIFAITHQIFFGPIIRFFSSRKIRFAPKG